MLYVLLKRRPIDGQTRDDDDAAGGNTADGENSRDLRETLGCVVLSFAVLRLDFHCNQII